MSNLNNNKADITISAKLCFYSEKPHPNIWGSNNIAYEVYYDTKTGIMQVFEFGAFGDATLVGRFNDRRGRGITLPEMLENIQEISNMTLEEFRAKCVRKD